MINVVMLLHHHHLNNVEQKKRKRLTIDHRSLHVQLISPHIELHRHPIIIVMERFYAYGLGPGVPLKPGGKSAAVVAIQ